MIIYFRRLEIEFTCSGEGFMVIVCLKYIQLWGYMYPGIRTGWWEFRIDWLHASTIKGSKIMKLFECLKCSSNDWPCDMK